MSAFPLEDEDPIVVSGLVNRFDDKVVHRNVSLSVRRGEILGVVGGSGSGKTVLLNSIIGLRSPDEGTIRVFGRDVATLTNRQREHMETRWGVLFQQGALFSALTVRENVAAPLVEHTRMPISEIDELARALALDPELLFLDEPTAGLDPIGAAAFDKLLRELTDNLGLTVFMVTHDLDSLYTVADRVAVLADGEVVALAPVRELEQSSHPWIREYFLGPRGRAAKGTG